MKIISFMLLVLLGLIAQGTEVTKEAMVSTTHSLATQVGVEILKNGGNAIDASIAIQLVLSVIQPQSTGIGGGCLVLYYSAHNDTVYALDGREEAPAAFHGRQFCANPLCISDSSCSCDSGLVPSEDRKTGGHSAGTPGIPRALDRLLREFGSLSFREVAQPAIDFARNGFPVYSSFYNAIASHAHRLALFPASAELFLDPNDLTKPKNQIGETFYNPDLADTLERMASIGVEDFYSGEIAHDIVESARHGLNPNSGKYGLMTAEDLIAYRPVYRAPINVTYRDHMVFGFPPPSSGGIALLQMLNFLEGFDLKEAGPFTVESFHRMIDSQNVAFADRNKYVGDADFVSVPVQQLIEKEYMAARREALSSPTTAIPTPVSPGVVPTDEEYAVTYSDHEVGTTHWSVVDQFGNGVAFTSTIEEIMGSALVVTGRGFLLNNEMTDFEAYESDENGLFYANAPEGGKKPRRTAVGSADSQSLGGKRPRSSMTPTLAFNSTTSELYLAIGAPGGSSIIGAVLNVFVNAVDFGLDLQEATDLGRALGKNGEVSAEEEVYEADNGELYNGLVARGFNFSSPVPTTYTYGRVQTVLNGKDNNIYGAADTFREPMAEAAGF